MSQETTQSPPTSPPIATTPMMAQWHACKSFAKDALLLFRMGDFYEAFYEDAAIVAKELELTLTKRQDIPMSGLPHFTSEGYIDKLVAKGYKVAIAEQTEDPKKAKGLVKREVVRIITPGTHLSSSPHSQKNNNYFASLTQVGSLFGLAYIDLSTSEFRVIEFEALRDLQNALYRIQPKELLVSRKFHDKNVELLIEMRKTHSFLISTQEDFHFEHKLTYNTLTHHFKVLTLDGFGLRGYLAGINAAGALLTYLKDNLCHSIDHILSLETLSLSQYLSLDEMTIRNLELTESLNDRSRRNTLLSVLDHTQTPMGARLLKNWIKEPHLSLEAIHFRQEVISTFLNHEETLDALLAQLSRVFDLERLMMKISSGMANPRDIVSFACSFEPLPTIKALLKGLESPLIDEIEQKIDHLPLMTQRIFSTLSVDAPIRLSDGAVIREGFSKELDELRSLSKDSKAYLASYQNQLREETGIKTLRVGFNRMFGYFIEVSKAQSDKMPSSFYRRQTLVNAERFITEELKAYESKVITAEERILQIETELFNELKKEVSQYAKKVIHISQAIAKLDCLVSLSESARRNNYVRPIVDNSSKLEIIAGRHPVIESCELGSLFIPNDTVMDDEKSRMFIITGPNMAGKSTYIRQVALIVIMAQMGAFIPAKSAHIGLIDKVFTRIGASDDLTRGQSTFMVEMTETAQILHNATSRSLVILDEIGRGTSTYDGISIAWAVAEYILSQENKKAKTLFATHYFELTKLEEKMPGAVNYNVAVSEYEDHIVFLRKIVRGGTDRSYGIHVARLAGMPDWVVGRAKEILVHLEENANRESAFEPTSPKRGFPKSKKSVPQGTQLNFLNF